MSEQRHRALYAEEAERAVIGCMLRSDKHIREASVLSRDDFHNVAAATCFAAAMALFAERRPVDPLTLGERVDTMVGEELAAECAVFIASAVGTAAWSCREYVQSVRNASIRRSLVEVGEMLAQDAADATEATEAVIERAREKLRNMVVTNGQWSDMSSLLLKAYGYLEKKADGTIKPMSTGIRKLDKVTGGLFAGEMTIIGARPSVGKTAFGLHLALSAAKSGAKVCFISAEMSEEQIGARILSREGGVDGNRIREATLKDDDWALLSEAMLTAADLSVEFMCGTQTVEELRNEIQRKVDMERCDMVVIDYLQLIRTKRRFEKDHERLGYVSRLLKLMSLDFKIPVVVLAQVRRQNLGGSSRCPALDELRGSGDMEQDADNVIFLHKPATEADPTVPDEDKPYFWQLKDEGLDYMALSIAKQRQGMTGIVNTIFDPAKMRYKALERTQA